MRKLLFIAVMLLAFALPCAAQSVTVPVLPANPPKPLTITYRAIINSTISPNTGSVRSSVDVTGTNLGSLPPTIATTVLVTSFVLQSPVHFLWNGLLSMQNVVALTNKGATPQTVIARLLNANGSQLSSTPVVVPANGELDLPVSSLTGFQPSAFGVLRLEFSGDELDGNGFFYRLGADAQTLDYMIGLPLQNAMYGESYVNFNTIQPSRRSTQLGNEVANWLSITNLDSGADALYRVEFYDQAGTLERTVRVSVPPLGRRDIAAGHEDSGPRKVGLARIIPLDAEPIYSAALVRYGASGSASNLSKFFHFALAMQARPGSAATQWAPISRAARGENWLVVTNVSSLSGAFRVVFHASSGATLGSVDLNLAPFAQTHLFAGSILGSDQTGYAEITSLSARELIAESTVYFYDSETNEATAAYASEARSPVGTVQFGVYNRFLSMANFVRGFDTSGAGANAVLTTSSEAGAPLGANALALSPSNGFEVSVHTLSGAPPVNSYGPIELDTTAANAVISEVLRYQPSADGQRIEAIASTPIR